MLKYYLRFSIKNLVREKTSTFVKVFGLTLGLTIFISVLLYVTYESSYDNYFSNSTNVLRVALKTTKLSGEIWHGSVTPVPLSAKLQEGFPEVLASTRMYQSEKESMFVKDNEAYETGHSFYVDETFFKVFNIDLLQGNTQTALEKPYSVMLSSSMAHRIFGDENPMGKVILYRNNMALNITGVFKDVPENTSFKYDVLISIKTPNFVYPKNNNNWDLFFSKTFILVNPNTNAQALAQKISEFASDYKPKLSKSDEWKFYLEPIESVHLFTKVVAGRESNITGRMVNILLLIAVFILIVALINHLNLSISQSYKRLKQNGIEMVSGQKRTQQYLKILVENGVIFAIALILSVLFVAFAIPLFESLLEIRIPLTTIDLSLITKVILVIVVSIALLSIVEFAFNKKVLVTNALKGLKNTDFSNNILKKGFIAFQFLVSIILIFVTTVFYSQTDYIVHKELGMDNDGVVVIKGNEISKNRDFPVQIETFKNELLKYPEITGVAKSNIVPGERSFTDGVGRSSDPNKKFVNNSIIITNADYLKTYSIKLLAGRNLPMTQTGNQRYALINEKCVHELGFTSAEEAIGEKITRQFFNREYEVIGVTDNFQFSNISPETYPVTMYYENRVCRYLSVKYSDDDLAHVQQIIENVWKEVFGSAIYRSYFLNSAYQKVYAGEYQQVRIYSICSLAAVLIACIGLWGLAFQSITQRAKEIGVRKVNGARILDILSLIYKDYFYLVIIAAVPAFIIAYLFASNWLENYCHKINIGVLYYLIPLILMMGIIFFTTSFHALKAATENPVDALRD